MVWADKGPFPEIRHRWEESGPMAARSALAGAGKGLLIDVHRAPAHNGYRRALPRRF